uniref:Uncharacterized protein n=1 Tax=Kalanchoe fedtschenkoi TaxID=63787 RepID=A0A7N0V0X8_KALFE
MVKGEDSIRRKKNKAARKKLGRKESVSARVAAISATKSAASLANAAYPRACALASLLRDRYRSKKDTQFVDDDDALTCKSKSYAKKLAKGADNAKKDQRGQKRKSGVKVVKVDNNTDDEKAKPVKNGDLVNAHKGKDEITSTRPSKVVLLCLNTILNALQNDYVSDGEGDMPFFANSWGIDFLKYYASGNDMLLVGGSCPTAQQIAWIVSAAADSVQKMEIGGFSTPVPFLLYIVPSQVRAIEVRRSVCKPLKGVGLHTVSVHSGVGIEHQIHGLKTPERLLELVSLKAVSIYRVSLMVVDKLEPEN